MTSYESLISLTEKQKKRFWSYCEKGDGCWSWKKSHDKNGYTRFYANKASIQGSRVSYYLTYGNLRKDDCVCHTCDNPGCVNPAHLWVGSKAENNKDMRDKMRHVYGETSKNAKLTMGDVIDIKRRLKYGESGLSISKDYPVSNKTISNILHGKKWAHVKLQDAL